VSKANDARIKLKGLYRLDQQTGKMELLVEHAAARFYLVQPERIQEDRRAH